MDSRELTWLVSFRKNKQRMPPWLRAFVNELTFSVRIVLLEL